MHMKQKVSKWQSLNTLRHCKRSYTCFAKWVDQKKSKEKNKKLKEVTIHSACSCFKKVRSLRNQKTLIRHRQKIYKLIYKQSLCTLIAWACALIFLSIRFLSSSLFKSRVYRNRRDAFSTSAACYETQIIFENVSNQNKSELLG